MNVCTVCGGPIHQSTVGSGFNRPVWVHLNDEDWVDNPHNAESERVRTYDAQGEPHDDVLITKTGKVLMEADLQRFAEEAEQGYEVLGLEEAQEDYMRQRKSND